MPTMPAIVSTGLIYFTALTLAVLLYRNVVKQEPKLRQLLQALWAATEPTAALAGRIAAVVALVWTLALGVALPFTVPFGDWIWGLLLGLPATAVTVWLAKRSAKGQG